MNHEKTEKHPHFLAIAIMAARAEQARDWQVAAMLWWQATGLATNRINGDWAQHRAEYCRHCQKDALSMVQALGDDVDSLVLSQ